jgi:hypothetical protein
VRRFILCLPYNRTDASDNRGLNISHVVWIPCRYEVLTFSRPAHPLSIMTYPLVRFYQQKFGADSARAVLTALEDKEEGRKTRQVEITGLPAHPHCK